MVPQNLPPFDPSDYHMVQRPRNLPAIASRFP